MVKQHNTSHCEGNLSLFFFFTIQQTCECKVAESNPAPAGRCGWGKSITGKNLQLAAASVKVPSILNFSEGAAQMMS